MKAIIALSLTCVGLLVALVSARSTIERQSGELANLRKSFWTVHELNDSLMRDRELDRLQPARTVIVQASSIPAFTPAPAFSSLPPSTLSADLSALETDYRLRRIQRDQQEARDKILSGLDELKYRTHDPYYLPHPYIP